METKTYLPMNDFIRDAIITLDGKDSIKKYTSILNEEEYIELEEICNLVDSLNYALNYAYEKIDELENRLFNGDSSDDSWECR